MRLPSMHLLNPQPRPLRPQPLMPSDLTLLPSEEHHPARATCRASIHACQEQRSSGFFSQRIVGIFSTTWVSSALRPRQTRRRLYERALMKALYSRGAQAKEWKAKLRKEIHTLDRQVMAIEREENKIKLSVKDAAKKGHVRDCHT